MDEMRAWLDSVDDPGELFVMTTRLMWHMYERAEEQGATEIAGALLVSVNELGCGPWTLPQSSVPVRVGIPFSVLASLLDHMINRLEDLTPGFGARFVIGNVRAFLDPRHSS